MTGGSSGTGGTGGTLSFSTGGSGTGGSGTGGSGTGGSGTGGGSKIPSNPMIASNTNLPSKQKEHHPNKRPVHGQGHHPKHQGHKYNPTTHQPIHVTKHPVKGTTTSMPGHEAQSGQNSGKSPSHTISTTHKPIDFSALHQGSRVYIEEVVEPGIMNKDVEIYRSNDSEEAKFKDAIPMDSTGFHLIILGTKEPTFE